VSRLNNDIGGSTRRVEAALAWLGNIAFLTGTIVMLLYSTRGSSWRRS
jgi:hypothetical protein